MTYNEVPKMTRNYGSCGHLSLTIVLATAVTYGFDAGNSGPYIHDATPSSPSSPEEATIVTPTTLNLIACVVKAFISDSLT